MHYHIITNSLLSNWHHNALYIITSFSPHLLTSIAAFHHAAQPPATIPSTIRRLFTTATDPPVAHYHRLASPIHWPWLTAAGPLPLPWQPFATLGRADMHLCHPSLPIPPPRPPRPLTAALALSPWLTPASLSAPPARTHYTSHPRLPGCYCWPCWRCTHHPGHLGTAQPPSHPRHAPTHATPTAIPPPAHPLRSLGNHTTTASPRLFRPAHGQGLRSAATYAHATRRSTRPSSRLLGPGAQLPHPAIPLAALDPSPLRYLSASTWPQASTCWPVFAHPQTHTTPIRCTAATQRSHCCSRAALRLQ